MPEELSGFLKDGIYISDQPCPKRTTASVDQPGTFSTSRVFLSLPSHRTVEQQTVVKHIIDMLDANGLIAEELSRSDYPHSSQLSEVRRRLKGCSGAVIFGFGQPYGQEGENNLSSNVSESISFQRYLTPTPWNHIEAGIAFVMDIPLLVISSTEFNQGIFDRTISEQFLYRLSLDSDWSKDPARTVFSNWALAVRERISHRG